MKTPTCPICGKTMEPTEAVVVMLRMFGAKSRPSQSAEQLPWACRNCHIVGD